jgi:hypothetical protein
MMLLKVDDRGDLQMKNSCLVDTLSDACHTETG